MQLTCQLASAVQRLVHAGDPLNQVVVRFAGAVARRTLCKVGRSAEQFCTPLRG